MSTTLGNIVASLSEDQPLQCARHRFDDLLHWGIEPPNTTLLALYMLAQSAEGAEFCATAMQSLGTSIELLVVSWAREVLIETLERLVMSVAHEALEGSAIEGARCRISRDDSTSGDNAIMVAEKARGICDDVRLVDVDSEAVYTAAIHSGRACT